MTFASTASVDLIEKFLVFESVRERGRGRESWPGLTAACAANEIL